MIFSGLYKSSPKSALSKWRASLPGVVPPGSDLEADLVSKDKARQKEAVKKYLAEKIRNDWEFVWPPVTAEPKTAAREEGRTGEAAGDKQNGAAAPDAAGEDAARDPGEEADCESDTESVYSTLSEDPSRFRPRIEWTSDLSDTDESHIPASPFRFDNPDAVGEAVRSSIESRRTRRRRALREEAKWNPGLACFEARRNAWTGAKTVRLKPKPKSPTSPSSTRRLFWRHHRTQSSASNATSGSPPSTSPLEPTTTRSSEATTASEPNSGKSARDVQRTTSHDSSAAARYPVETVVPIPPPLLPPQNPMRASVQPSMYTSLYDKIVVQNLQPSCPVNLADMVRACVAGWKRDGEWPPKSSYLPVPAAVPVPARQRKAQRQQQQQQRQRQQQQQQQQQRKPAASTPSTGGFTSRRLSFGFWGGGGGGGGGGGANKEADKAAPQQEATKENSQSQSHSDEAGSGSKTLFRRSLQKVLSLGQHQPQHHQQHGQGQANNNNGNANANANANANVNGAGAPPPSSAPPPPTKAANAPR